MTNQCKRVGIQEASQVGEARRAISAFAEAIGFSETARGKVAIVVNELGNNLVKHAGGRGGELVYRAVSEGVELGIEVLSLDRGRGMENVERCLSDGYSTAGSPGTGLGAVRRLSRVFDIYSQPGKGTAILAQIGARAVPPGASPTGTRRAGLEIGGVCLPYPGEAVSGDAWEATVLGDASRLMLADGLGHGPSASIASEAATTSFTAHPELAPPEAIARIHLALRSTRGAAVAVAQVDERGSKLRYAGVGNTAAVVFSRTGEARRLVSHNGTAGVQVRKIQEFDYPWDAQSVLVLHSDGLATSWGFERYPGLIQRHPSLVAGVLYRDYARGRDDVSVVVASARWEGAA